MLPYIDQTHLYKAIIKQALIDVFPPEEPATAADLHVQNEAWRWFNYKGPAYEANSITFIDACDLGGVEYERIKARAAKAHRGEVPLELYRAGLNSINKKKLKEKIEAEEVKSPSVQINELPRIGYLYTNEEGESYVATF